MTDYVAYVAKDPINQRGELSGAQEPGSGAGMYWGVTGALTRDLHSLPHLGML